MKRLQKLTVALACALAFATKAYAAEEISPQVIENSQIEIQTVYATDRINVRLYPGIDQPIVGKIDRNEPVNKILVPQIEEWTTVFYNSEIAYIHSDYLSTEKVQIAETDDDLYILAHLLAGECQSCPDEEQLYVGSVVLNRVASSHYPDSIEEVVFQKGQYSCTWDGNYYREPTEANWANAEWLLENGSVLPENVVYQSGGKQGSGVYLKTEWHYYCYY